MLWRAQTLSVEALRLSLLRMAASPAFRPLYAVVSWFGTLVHELSHASVLLLSGHGIREFRVKVERGFVTPARMRRGPISFLFFLVAALAPLFVPPLLVLAGWWWLEGSNPIHAGTPSAGLTFAAEALYALVVDVPVRLAWRLAHLDLSHALHLALFLAALLGMPSARPSHVKGSRFHGEKDEGDVAVLRARLRENPWPFILFVAVLVVGHVAARMWWPEAYWVPFSWVVSVAVIGITLALLGSVGWALFALAGRSRPMVAWLAPLAAVAVQVFGRSVGAPVAVNAASALAFLATALVLAILMPRR